MEKRQHKPRTVFSPDPHVRVPRGSKNGGKLNGKTGPGKDKRQRNVVADATCHNKWLVYQNRLTKLLAILRTQSHFVEVMTQQKRERTASQDNEVSEVTRCMRKIGAAKCAIIALFQEISCQNKDHKMFPQLEADADESGLIDVDEVVCSLCGTDDVEGNDVLLCDRSGCCRAYHQQCLSPPVDISDDNDPDADWFCWQCECIDDCLGMVNEQSETDTRAWEDLFPELRSTAETGLLGGVSDESEEDDEDDDYNPEPTGDEDAFWENSDVGYDTDELSYDGISVDENATPEGKGKGKGKGRDKDDEDEDDDEDGLDDDNDEIRDGVIQLEKDRDLECGIDADEVVSLINEVRTEEDEAHLNSVTVAGRRLRARVHESTKIDPAYTVEGAGDVNKRVLKVKRGVVVLGTVVAYSPFPEGASSSSTSSSSSSSSFNGATSAPVVFDGVTSTTLHANPIAVIDSNNSSSSSNSNNSSSSNDSSSSSGGDDCAVGSAEQEHDQQDALGVSILESVVQESLNQENRTGIIAMNEESQIIAKNVLEEHSLSSGLAVDSILDPSLTTKDTHVVSLNDSDAKIKNGTVCAQDLHAIATAASAVTDSSSNLPVLSVQPLPHSGSTVEAAAADTVDPSHYKNVLNSITITSDYIKDKEHSSIVTGTWHVLYDDGSEATLNEIALSKALLDAKEHFKAFKNAQRAATFKQNESLIEAKGALDASNVLTHKRSRKHIDYALLSLQMFGTVVDDDPEADENVNTLDDYSVAEVESEQVKKRKKKTVKDEHTGKKSDVESPFKFDHILFQSSPALKKEQPKTTDLN